ncbi:MAG: phosphate ABC transporter permease subunit PstC [Bacteroidota bacterium]|nr:phosphate ABC transporter permease subunit PstC [Bacteroidota bacterium]
MWIREEWEGQTCGGETMSEWQTHEAGERIVPRPYAERFALPDERTGNGWPSPNRFLRHRPLAGKKRFDFGEFAAEYVIRGIALLSICAIFGIFYYVFQESRWAFRGGGESVQETAGAGSRGNENAQAASGAGQEEEIRPQTYGLPETAGESAAETGASGVSREADAIEEGRRTSLHSETSGNDEPVTLERLLLPNDIIDNEPRYVWQPISVVPKYSFVPLFVGALKVTLVGISIAAPVAILAALFMTTFAPRWLREIMKPAIEILAGFPSVVIGFFCLITVASVIQEITGATYRLNALVGGIGMSIAVIPIIFTVVEDSLSTVPRHMREASIALGASRWQTAWRVVLPAAAPGVFAAVILGIGRAFGETMIALMATGNAAQVSWNILESVRTMSATIGAEMAEVEFHSVHYGVLFLIGTVLFVVTFSLNAFAEFVVRKRLIKRFQGR